MKQSKQRTKLISYYVQIWLSPGCIIFLFQCRENDVTKGTLIREGQLTVLRLSSQCTVLIAVSMSVSDYILQMFCLPIHLSVGYAANSWRMNGM